MQWRWRASDLLCGQGRLIAVKLTRNLMPNRVSHYDLHTHSTFSDGTLPPAQVIARAARRGVKAISLTDHDETSGLAEARAAAEATGIELIDGVEISASWEGHTVHVVGLLVDPAHPVLVEGLRRNRGGRSARAERMAAS